MSSWRRVLFFKLLQLLRLLWMLRLLGLRRLLGWLLWLLGRLLGWLLGVQWLLGWLGWLQQLCGSFFRLPGLLCADSADGSRRPAGKYLAAKERRCTSADSDDEYGSPDCRDAGERQALCG